MLLRFMECSRFDFLLYFFFSCKTITLIVNSLWWCWAALAWKDGREENRTCIFVDTGCPSLVDPRVSLWQTLLMVLILPVPDGAVTYFKTKKRRQKSIQMCCTAAEAILKEVFSCLLTSELASRERNGAAAQGVCGGFAERHVRRCSVYWPESLPTRFESTVQVGKLQDLINRSKMARCRGRFVCPVILYKGKVKLCGLTVFTEKMTFLSAIWTVQPHRQSLVTFPNAEVVAGSICCLGCISCLWASCCELDLKLSVAWELQAVLPHWVMSLGPKS